MDDQLVEQLPPVEIDRTTTHFPPENRDALFAAVGQIHFLHRILVVADAKVRLGRRQQNQAFHLEPGQSVVDQLRIEPRHVTQVV